MIINSRDFGSRDFDSISISSNGPGVTPSPSLDAGESDSKVRKLASKLSEYNLLPEEDRAAKWQKMLNVSPEPPQQPSRSFFRRLFCCCCPTSDIVQPAVGYTGRTIMTEPPPNRPAEQNQRLAAIKEAEEQKILAEPIPQHARYKPAN
jgi:hypothetical protein